MKKLTALSLLLILLLTLPAFADVIWEPENKFYEQHADDCQYHSRSYYANSPQGYVEIRTAPNGKVTATADNQTRLYIYYLYKDWGYVDNQNLEGWVAMEDLVLVYDYIAFAEDYADQISPDDPSVTVPLLDAYLQSGGETLVFWPYPNAEQITYHTDGEFGVDMLESLKEYGFSSTFTDEEGHLWGFCGYLYGNRNFWVLLDDPGAGDGVPFILEDGQDNTVGERIVSVRKIPEIDFYPAAVTTPQLSAIDTLTITLVAAAVLLSAGALWFFYGKKRRKNDKAE